MVVEGLEVDPERMLHNLQATDGLILSERVMMELAPSLGRERADDLVYEASMRAFEESRPLVELLLEDETIANTMESREQLETMLDPTSYTGLCGTFVDQVLADHERRSQPGTP